MFKKILIATFLIITVGFLTNYLLSLSNSSAKSTLLKKPVTENQVSKSPQPTKPPASSQDDLLKKIKNIFFETNPDIDFGFTVYDLKTDSMFGYNDQEPQHAASVTKVLTGTYLLKRVQDGKIELNDDLGAFTVEFNLKQMVNQSNTESWEIIDDFLGINSQQEFIESIGFTSVDFRQNLMSPKDAAVFYAKLYKGELLEEPYQRKLLSYMQNTETENLITPAIPQSITLYHKTGLFEGEVHDVAIIDHSSHPFVIAIFTVNKLYPDYEGRAKLIQKVASEVYSYMTR